MAGESVLVRLRALGQRAFSAALTGAARDVDRLGEATLRARAAADEHESAVARARDALAAQEEAAKHVATALRQYGSDSTQARQAQERLSSAQARVNATSVELERASQGVESAQDGVRRATDRQTLALERARWAAAGVGRGFSRLGGTLAGVGRRMRNVALAVTGLGAVLGTAGLARAVRSTTGDMISLNAQWQTLNTQFATLIGDRRAAEAWVETMRDVTSASPLRLTEALDGARGLIAAGMRLDRVRDVVVAMQNAALVGRDSPAENYQQIAEILGVIQARGRITAQELSRFDAAGVSVRKILQRELGMTADEVAEIGRHSVSARRAIDALIRAWTGGAMRRAVREAEDTWDVQVMRARKQLEQLRRLVGEGLFDRLNRREMPTLHRSLRRAIELVQGRAGPRGPLGVRLRWLWAATRRDWEPTVRALEDAIRRARVGELLEEAINKGTPAVARAAARAASLIAPKAVSAFVRGFMALPLWGKLLAGGWLVHRFSGGGVWPWLGRRIGGAMLRGIRARLASRAAGEALAGAAAGSMADSMPTAVRARAGRFRRAGRVLGRALGVGAAGTLALVLAQELADQETPEQRRAWREIGGPSRRSPSSVPGSPLEQWADDAWEATGARVLRWLGLTGRSRGGVVRHGETTLVGERGPEIVRLPAGSRVTPAAETRRILGQTGGGRVVVPTIEVPVVVSGVELARAVRRGGELLEAFE